MNVSISELGFPVRRISKVLLNQFLPLIRRKSYLPSLRRCIMDMMNIKYNRRLDE